jgi:hypothetical protein
MESDVEHLEEAEERPKTKGKRQRASFHILFPRLQQHKDVPVVKELRWWNTHYKHMHEWNNGRVEVLFDRNVKGFDKNHSGFLEHECPYCHKKCKFHRDAITKVKGTIVCPFCKEQYGVHPNGQVFVVRTVQTKVASIAIQKKEVMGWINQAITYLDAEVDVPRKGDDGVDRDFEEFVDLLESSGFEYRRLQ